MANRHQALSFLLALAVTAAGAPAARAAGETSCTLEQVTASGSDSHAGGLSADGRYLALTSRGDLTGGNPDHGWDLFLYDRQAEELAQLTHLTEGFVQLPTLDADGTHVLYRTNVDPDTGLVTDNELLVRLARATGERTVVAQGFADAAVSADGTRVALLSAEDFTGGNGDGNEEVFLLDLATDTYVQITDTLEPVCPPFPGTCPANLEPRIDADGSRVAFYSDLDPTATGEPSSFGGIFVYDAATGVTTRVTVHADARLAISGDGGHVAFPSIENLSGENPDKWVELFAYALAADRFRQVPGPERFLNDPVAFDRDGTRLVFNAVPQIGNGRDALLFDLESGVVAPILAVPGVDDFAAALTTDGAWASLHSKANVEGGNPDGSFEVFLAQCAEETVPPPPAGAWITDSEFPDFRFKVRITAGGEPQPVRQESACIPETVCISGAVPGRSELFIRIVGPKPNGKLWPTLVRFSTSTLEVWIEQLSTGDLEYYRLEGATPGSSDLTGLFDRDGFTP